MHHIQNPQERIRNSHQLFYHGSFRAILQMGRCQKAGGKLQTGKVMFGMDLNRDKFIQIVENLGHGLPGGATHAFYLVELLFSCFSCFVIFVCDV